MGYTALEGLLNYVYYQAGALNQYDQVSHLLHFSLYGVNQSGGPCGEYETGRDPETGEPGVPAADGGTTTNILKAHRCVAWLGDSAAGINEDIGLPRYDPSVCPQGTEPERAAEELCDPDIPSNRGSVAFRSGGTGLSTADPGGGDDAGTAPPPVTGPIPGLPAVPGEAEEVTEGLEDLLGLPGGADLDGLGKGLGKGLPSQGKGGQQATEELMDFLFGS